MTEEYLVEFGWRIPFICGLVVGFIGLYIRWNLQESPVYQAAKANGNLSRAPLSELFKLNLKELLIGMAIYLTVTVPFYIMTVYLDSFVQLLEFSAIDANRATIISLVSMTIILPISAYISDKIGRKPVMQLGCCGILFFSYKLFCIMNETSSSSVLFLAIACMSALTGFFMGPVPTVLVELFPTRIRFTGVALSYNLSAAIFGGTAPVVSAMLIKRFNNNIVLSYYICFFVVITLIALTYFKETYKNSLHDEK